MNNVDAIINMSIAINSNNRIVEQSTDEQRWRKRTIMNNDNDKEGTQVVLSFFMSGIL